MQDDFNIDRDRVVGCAIDYKNFIEEKDTIENNEKIINDFLAMLPAGGVSQLPLEIKDIERLQENDQRNFKAEFLMLKDFAQVVKSECVMKAQFFSFYDIPDLIVKKRYTRKDYDVIIKLLNKVKKLFLAHKATIVQGIKLEDLSVTDEDLVPLDLFDQVLKAKEDKQEQKKNLIGNLIANLRNDAIMKIKATGIEIPKTKKIIENSVFITSLNQYLDAEHTKIFSWYYKNQILYLQFIVTQKFFSSALQFQESYDMCKTAEHPNNTYNA